LKIFLYDAFGYLSDTDVCCSREWQMYRAFQTMMTLHRPDVVFVLGNALYHCLHNI